MGPNSLDALCKRYRIDNSMREKHGALLDSELLAEVYIELVGGKQARLGLEVVETRNFAAAGSTEGDGGAETLPPRPEPLLARLSEVEIAAHGELVAKLGDKAIWIAAMQKGG